MNWIGDSVEAIDGAVAENMPKGRLVKVSNSTSTTRYRFDGLGRPLASSQQFGSGTAYVFLYTQRPAGMASMTYPSGRVVNWTQDVAGRKDSVKGVVGGKDYASSVLYSPFGGVSQLSLGSGLVEKWGYSDKRGQVRRIALGTAANETAAGEWLFSYCADGLYSAECTTNNGNLRHQEIQPLGRVQSYNTTLPGE